MPTLFDEGLDFQKLAIEKINSELKSFKGDKKGQRVYTYVANSLREFCEKDETFAEVVYKTKRTLSDCVSEIMKGCGDFISDIETYRRAAKFYFPNSEIEFVMTITLVGEEPDEKYLNKESKKSHDSEHEGTPKIEKKNPKPSKKKEQAEIIQISLL